MARWTDGRLPLLYSSGLAPVLFPEQSRTGETRCYRGPTGEPVLNPAGHFEALRWLVLNGILGEMAEDEVVLFISYSNWGRIYTEETLSLQKWRPIGGAAPTISCSSEKSVKARFARNHPARF